MQILTLKMCYHDISKTITARSSLNFDQLIEDDRKLIGENLKTSHCMFFELSPFADLDFENEYP